MPPRPPALAVTAAALAATAVAYLLRARRRARLVRVCLLCRSRDREAALARAEAAGIAAEQITVHETTESASLSPCGFFDAAPCTDVPCLACAEPPKSRL